MIETLIRKKRVAEIRKTSLISGGIAAAFSLMTFLGNALPEERTPFNTLYSVLFSAAIGIAVPYAVLTLQFGFLGKRRFRKMNHLVQLAISGVAYIACSVAVFFLAFTIGECIRLVLSGTPLTDEVSSRLVPELVSGLKLALALGFVIMLGLAGYSFLQEFLGHDFLRNIAKGLYVRVEETERIIAFLDLKGSTAIAERLSPERFFDLLNDFLGYIEMYCMYYGGSIYKYIGDGAIVTWPADGESAGGAFEMYRQFGQEILLKREEHVEKYGIPLEFTAGFHAGKILAGGLGISRKELGYWGDTINTASRIQSACGKYRVPVLFSHPFMKLLIDGNRDRLSGVRFLRIRNVELRGKKRKATLYSLPENFSVQYGEGRM